MLVVRDRKNLPGPLDLVTLWVITPTQLNLTSVPCLTVSELGHELDVRDLDRLRPRRGAGRGRSERQNEGREGDRDECPLHGQWFLLFGFAFTRIEPRMNGWIRQKYVYVLPALRRGGVVYWLEPVVTSWLRPVP